MFETCVNQNCGLETNQYCAICKRPFCQSCAKFGLCRDCKVPHTVTRNNNRLSLVRKRRLTQDEPHTNNPQDEQELLSQSLPDPQELRLSLSRKRKLPPDEPPGDTNQQQDEQDLLSQSLPDPEEPQAQKQQTVKGPQCQNCHATVTYLRKHLKDTEMCAIYYKEQFAMEDIDDIANKIIRDDRNMNRRNKRREDVANGNARDRTVEIEQRRDRSHMDCWNDHFRNQYNLLVVPCVFCECKFSRGKGMEKLPDDDIQLVMLLDVYPERREKHMFENDLWKCKTCEAMSKRLNGNQSLCDCFMEVLNIDENDASETVLIMRYDDSDYLSSVFLPKLNGETELEYCDATNDEKQFTAMIPNSLVRLSTEGSIQPEVAEFFVNRTEIDSCILLSALYTDTDQRMKAAERQIEASKETTRVGSVDNNILNLEENKNAHDYHLKQLRCTEAYQKKLIRENLAKQDFNGKQNLNVDIKLPDLPCGLTTVLLNEQQIPVEVFFSTDEQGYQDTMEIVPCQLDNNSFCDIHTCDRVHKSSTEKLDEIYKEGLPESTLPIVCRFMKQFVDSLVNNVFAKLTDQHHLQLEFHRNGDVHLVGNVWLKELIPYNETGERLTDKSVIPRFFTEALDLELLTEKRELDLFGEIEKVSEETSRHLEMDDWKHVREGSLKEMIYMTGRGFKNIWASQSVVNINVSNPTNMKQICKRKQHIGDENEEVFYDAQRGEWVMVSTVRRKFVLKSDKMKHLTAGQFAGNYRKPDPRFENDLDNVIQQLTENDGVWGESDISVITNWDKYPNELKHLPQWILLTNGKLMKLRKNPAVILPTGRLDHFGLRVLCEPFETEQQLIDEQRNNAALPELETLQQRLKEMYPTSSFEIHI
jgi:hypothetical protein